LFTEKDFGFIDLLKNPIFFNYLNLLESKIMPDFNAFTLGMAPQTID